MCTKQVNTYGRDTTTLYYPFSCWIQTFRILTNSQIPLEAPLLPKATCYLGLRIKREIQTYGAQDNVSIHLPKTTENWAKGDNWLEQKDGASSQQNIT